MSTLVTRAGKGSPLSHNEVDANFNNLNTDKIQSGNTVAALTITALTTPSVQAGSSAGLALKNSAGTTQVSMGAGGGDNVTVSAPIAITPANGLVNIAPTGTGSLTINPATAGTMNNMAIGGTTAAAATVTSLTIGTTQLGAGNASIMKNRIINGAMVIAQRGTSSVTIGSGNTYTLDRWLASTTQDSKFTVQQNAGSVTPPVGFVNYIGATSSSAYSVLTGDYFNVQQRIEGFNMADLQWGTADAKTITISFWVNSSLTGTFGGAIKDSTNNYSYPYTYTISAANTWEQKSITIVGPTAGTWSSTNGIGMQVLLSLGAGATFSGTAGAWAASDFRSATGATSVVGTSGATFYITGVQLEVGTQATGFEYRQYQQELALCQRYYYKEENLTNAITLAGFTTSTTGAALFNNFPVTMRIAPTALEQTGTAANYRVVGGGASATTCSAVPAFSSATKNLARTTFTVASGLTVYNGCVGNPASGVTAYLAWSAEL
jgi:hypothetical protein